MDGCSVQTTCRLLTSVYEAITYPRQVKSLNNSRIWLNSLFCVYTTYNLAYIVFCKMQEFCNERGLDYTPLWFLYCIAAMNLSLVGQLSHDSLQQFGTKTLIQFVYIVYIVLLFFVEVSKITMYCISLGWPPFILLILLSNDVTLLGLGILSYNLYGKQFYIYNIHSPLLST